ncbi:MAG TPA: S41 family peptidase [Blastocatellia bacterium]|nr:S41 family peptidase [Blastocatellia bacterium]
MKTRILLSTFIILLVLAAPGFQAVVRQGQRLETAFVARETSGTLFENVAAVLKKRYYDGRFRAEVLPGLILRYEERARRATTLDQQRDVVQEFLSHIPASHLGLLSKRTHRYMIYDLLGRPYPTFGFQLTQIRGEFYASAVLEGGPAQRAGVLAWDRVISIDGIPTGRSHRVDWRSDDAYIPDDRDPPVHYLIAEPGERIKIEVERTRRKVLSITIPAEYYSALEAAKASIRIHRLDGRSFGYLHLWYIHINGVPEFLKQKLEGELKDCHGVILDLRGRGGNGIAVWKILDVLRADREARRRPLVALVDRQSRSAKDLLAYEMKRTGLARVVGESTAGAVIPATFAEVGHDSVLMFPSFKLPRYTDLLEFKPVEPDVFIERAGPLSAGKDPILKAGLAEAARLAKSTERQRKPD